MTTPTRMYAPTDTPWGTVEEWECSDLGAGVWLVPVPGTGGIHISGPAADALPDELKRLLINGPEWAEANSELPIVIACVIDLLDRDLLKIHYPQALSDASQPVPPVIVQAHHVCRHSPRYSAVAHLLPAIPQELLP